jgi:hypothetical protein
MLYRRWIIANGWSEGAGLSSTFLLAFLVLHGLETRPGPGAIILGAVLAVLLGTLLEGVLVGFAQGRVLHRYAPLVGVGHWTVATAIGAGTAWLLGMVPSTLIALMQSTRAPEPGQVSTFELPALVQYGAAALMGLVLGVVLALPQMIVLRRVVERPARWLTANAVAWLLGMPLIFFGMDRLPWGGPSLPIAAGVVAVSLVTGAVVGAVHGLWLRQMLRVAEPIRAPRT